MSLSGEATAVWAALICLVLGCNGAARGEARGPTAAEHPDAELPYSSRTPVSIRLVALPPVLPPTRQHAFWDRENLYLFGGIAAVRTLDYTSTLNMLRRGREEILLPGGRG